MGERREDCFFLPGEDDGVLVVEDPESSDAATSHGFFSSDEEEKRRIGSSADHRRSTMHFQIFGFWFVMMCEQKSILQILIKRAGLDLQIRLKN